MKKDSNTMTIRDHFAMAAMNSYLDHMIRRGIDGELTSVARQCYRLADAMIRTRRKDDPETNFGMMKGQK